MARPVKEPSEEERKRVELLSGYSLTQEQIANVMGLHVQTLRKHCKQEMKRGKDIAYTQAVNSLFANIKKHKEASIFFYLKTQHGWREKAQLEITGDVNNPVAFVSDKPLSPNQFLLQYAPEPLEADEHEQ